MLILIRSSIYDKFTGMIKFIILVILIAVALAYFDIDLRLVVDKIVSVFQN